MDNSQSKEAKDGVSVIVIDDEDEARRSYARLLDMDPEFFCAQAFSDGQSALKWLDEGLGMADVVLTDIMMPGMTGIECAVAMKARWPINIVMMTGFAKKGLLEEALAIGVDGFLSKPFGKDQLIATLQAVINGQTVVYAKFCEEMTMFSPSDLAHHIGLGGLSERHHQVMANLAAGKTNREIAKETGISIAVVKKLIHEIFGKLGVKNRTEAAVWSQLNGPRDRKE